MNIKKQNAIKWYKTKLAQMFSDGDIKRYFGENVPILKYHELANYHNILQLLPFDKSMVILLVETEKNSGHWVCLMRYGKTIESFDSYGCDIDHELKYINPDTKQSLGENEKFLSELAKTTPSDMKFIHNKHRFQELSDGVNTCGKWTCARLIMMQCGYDNDEFKDVIEEHCHELKCPPDILICKWIL